MPYLPREIVYIFVYMIFWGFFRVHCHKSLKRDIARSFSSSTIAMYGFMAFMSACPVHFIITSDGMPSCNAVTTNVRRPQWVVSNAHLGITCSIRSLPWK